MTTPDQGPAPEQGTATDQQGDPRPQPHPRPAEPAQSPTSPEAGRAARDGGGAASSGSGADAPGPPGFFPVPDPDVPDQHPDDQSGDGEGRNDEGGVAGRTGPWQRDMLALRDRQRELDQALRRISRALQIQEQRRPDAADASGPATPADSPELLELGRRVAGLEDAVESLSVLVGEQQRAANPPMDWTRMRAAEARHAWPVLAQWVGEVLVPCYELTRADLPDCWALHQQAVYELSWLRSTHVQAHLPHVHPDVTAQWYTRWRPAALARIRELIPDSRCRPGEHQVTMEESRTRRAETSRPGQTLPATSTDTAAVPPRAQPAVVAHWWANYCMAAHADIAARAAREDAPVTDWAPPGLLEPVPDARYPVPDPYRVDP